MEQERVDKFLSLAALLGGSEGKIQRGQEEYWTIQNQVAAQLGLHIAQTSSQQNDGDGKRAPTFASIQEDDLPIDNSAARAEKEVLIATLFASALDDLREDPAFSGTSEQIQLLRESLSVGEI